VHLMLNIAKDKLPDEFKDEARLDSLFSPFRSHTVNPKDWDAKISSWKYLISLYCSDSDVYSFNLALLSTQFVRNGRPPSCLGVVVEEMVKSGDLQYLEDFLKESPKTWGGWAADLLVKKPLSWSFNTIKSSLFANESNSERTYVHVVVIRREAQKLFSAFPGKHRNKVINFSGFLKLIGKDFSQAENIKLLLHHLVREWKVDVKELKNASSDFESFLVKVGEQNKLVPISEVDITGYTLEQNEKLLVKSVEELEDQVALCLMEVKTHLLKGHRQLAKTCLKRKHEIEKRLTHKANALHNIQVLLERIKDVHTDAGVWRSYKQAISAFNSTIQETGLTEDSVEDTMNKLADMLDVYEEIQGAISKPATSEDDDLEEELAELMKSEEKPSDTSGDLDEQLAKLDISGLPEIPSPNVSSKEAPIS
jgi:charged multivesicular body protein 7